LVTFTPAQEKALDAMRKTIDRFRQNGASEQKIRRHVETWLRAYPADIRRHMENVLLYPWRLNVLDDRCSKCGDLACGWRGHAPVEVARRLPKRAMFARKR